VFMSSDAVSVAWEGIIDDAVNKYPKLDRNKFFEILNGFDPDDIPEKGGQKKEYFTITYTGSLYTIQNPKNLFHAVSELIANDKVDKNKILFQFVGRIADEVLKTIENSNLKDNIKIFPYQPHSKVMEILADSDCSLLIGVDSAEKMTNVPGKTFEYIGIKKPILTIAPENSKLADVAGSSGLAKIADHDDTDKLKRIFYDLYSNWKKGESSVKFENDLIQMHSRLDKTHALAEVLDKIKRSGIS